MAEKDRFRTRDIRVKLTEEEYTILDQNCFELDMSKSEFIRQIIVYGRLTENVKSVDNATLEVVRKMNYEINRIGNNINQLTYKVNANNYSTLNDIEQLKEMLIFCAEQIRDTLLEVST